MNKRTILLVLFIFPLIMCACSNNTCEDGKKLSESYDANNSTDVVDLNDEGKSDGISMKIVSLANVDKGADRIEITPKYVEWRIDAENNEDMPIEHALCLVTLVNINSDFIKSEVGTSPPLTIRIDRIYLKNAVFSLNEGEEIISADYGVWRRLKDGYQVSYRDGTIAMTEIGAQYIVIIDKIGPEEDNEWIYDKTEYRVEPYTVPIMKNSSLPRQELYKTYDLPYDFMVCSEQLIEKYINNIDN